MSKIHLPQDKETIIIVSIVIGLVILLAFDMLTLVPKLIAVYAPTQKVSTSSPIDAKILQDALKILESN
jgi:hypothetical protein